MTDTTSSVHRGAAWVDRLLLGVLLTFALTSLAFDMVSALDIPISDTSPSPFARLLYRYYAKDCDPYLIANPPAMQIQCAVSAFVFGGFYLAATYAFLRRRDWIRIPALMYSATMLYSLVLYLGIEFVGPLKPENPTKLLLANIPYGIFAVVMAWRFWRRGFATPTRGHPATAAL